MDGTEILASLTDQPALDTLAKPLSQAVRDGFQAAGVAGQRDGRTALGGDVERGTLKDESVVCPWHGSEFGLHDGRVINGPATQSQPCFDVREGADEIEIKVRD